MNWLSHFDKIVLYHDWTENIQLKEFMMAMTNYADIWWKSLNREQRSHIKTVRAAFEDHYGGETMDLMETMHRLENCNQGAESMITFGPKIQVMLEQVYDKAHLQLHTFYLHVNPEVADYVSASNPKTLKQAITTAINIERIRKTSNNTRTFSKSPATPHY
ncbi:hypothetical protein, partial, partial [Parasitella parasitica]